MPTDQFPPQGWGHGQTTAPEPPPKPRIAYDGPSPGPQDPPGLVQNAGLVQDATEDQGQDHPILAKVWDRGDPRGGGLQESDPAIVAQTVPRPVEDPRVRVDEEESSSLA